MLASSASPVALTVHADHSTETFIIDHAFNLVARGVGRMHCELPPGIYKLKYRNGGALQQTLLEVSVGSPPIAVTAPSLAVSGAAPLRGGQDVSNTQLLEAERISSGPAMAVGRGSHLFLFVRSPATASLPDEPADRFFLSVHQLDGEKVAELFFAPPAPCAGILVQLDPGAYRLRSGCENGSFEQIVVTSAGWMTQVFLERRVYRTALVALGEASVLMCRGPFQPEDEMLRYAEAARIALGSRRRTMPRQLIQDLLTDKFESPMLGVYAAHSLIADNDKSLLHRLVNVLQRLVPNHPDVLALIPEARPSDIAVPPMLRSSWDLLLKATLSERAQLAEGSLAARIPATLLDGTPWLIWPERALLPEHAAEGPALPLLGIQQLIEAPENVDALEDIELSDAEQAVYSFLQQRSQLSKRHSKLKMGELDEATLAKALRTSLPTARSTIHGLGSKLFSFRKLK